MEKMANTLNSMGIKASLSKSTNIFDLSVKGINNVFNSFRNSHLKIQMQHLSDQLHIGQLTVIASTLSTDRSPN